MKKVGAGILNIITESLYDKPIVVFREYVQNSADSFAKISQNVNVSELSSIIWTRGNNLMFLDNGKGIDEKQFKDEMSQIASSGKKKTTNMGYKGIGRLSGLPYCKNLLFINICSYKNDTYQKYQLKGELYYEIKKRDDYGQMDINELIEEISEYYQKVDNCELGEIKELLSEHKDMFKNRDTGFLVILEDITPILKQIIKDEKKLIEDLNWLLPVKFKDELFNIEGNELFEEMMNPDTANVIPAVAYNIFFNNKTIERPISKNMLRKYLCKINFKYAVGFHTFQHDKIAVIKDNPFSGIRIYIDNMLLCDENELMPILKENGFIEHTVNELIQTVKGIGAMIYITDKVNISANARRTFIEVADSDSVEFLMLLAEFVENIYNARYALSRYSSGKKKVETTTEDLEKLRMAANNALQVLAQEEIVVSNDSDDKLDYTDLSEIEQKQAVKKKILKEINEKIKMYLSQTISFNYDNAFEDFKTWLNSN